MPLSDSLAARMTVGLFAAICVGDLERAAAQLLARHDVEHGAEVRAAPAR